MTLEPVSNMIKEIPYNQREKVIQGNEEKFGIEWRYVWTWEQNRILLASFKKNPELLEKFRGEKSQIIRETEKPLRTFRQLLGKAKKWQESVPNNTASVFVKDASVFNEKEAGGKGTALGTLLHYSSNPEIPTSCAANWGKFPPGTILRINDKKYIVEDYGSFVNNHPNRIDRYLPSNIYKAGLAISPHVEVVQWWDFALAEMILKTRKPQKHAHIAMMLQQVREKLA